MALKDEILNEIENGGFTPLFLRGALAIVRGQVESISPAKFMAAFNEAERDHQRAHGDIRGPF